MMLHSGNSPLSPLPLPPSSHGPCLWTRRSRAELGQAAVHRRSGPCMAPELCQGWDQLIRASLPVHTALHTPATLLTPVSTPRWSWPSHDRKLRSATRDRALSSASTKQHTGHVCQWWSRVQSQHHLAHLNTWSDHLISHSSPQSSDQPQHGQQQSQPEHG